MKAPATLSPGRRPGLRAPDPASHLPESPPEGEAIPFVSVLMPIRNEADFIAESLGAVLAQDYPADRLEVIVADGMSDDGTRELVDTLGAEAGVSVRLVDNPRRIVATGLNIALGRARGDVIVRVDGHTVIASNYVRECVRGLQQSTADNVGGRMNAVGETSFGRAVATATSSPFGVGGARFHYSDKRELVDTVYMGAWRRDVFRRVGTFDEELVRNQDDEFNYRLREQGGTILLDPSIESKYHTRSSARTLWSQYFGYGLWKVLVLRKHPRQMHLRHLVPPIFAASLLLTAALAPFFRVDRFLFASEMGLYASANVTASLWTSRKGGVRQLPLLPPVFAILHLGYGFGFLAGVARFRRRLFRR
jgi:succinoglycan biosynthesis protein ExoA